MGTSTGELGRNVSFKVFPQGCGPRRRAEEGEHWHLGEGCPVGKEEGTLPGDQLMVLRLPQT